MTEQSLLHASLPGPSVPSMIHPSKPSKGQSLRMTERPFSRSKENPSGPQFPLEWEEPTPAAAQNREVVEKGPAL